MDDQHENMPNVYNQILASASKLLQEDFIPSTKISCQTITDTTPTNTQS